MINFEILYFQDCPTFVKACELVSEVIGKTDLRVSFSLEPINSSIDLETADIDSSPVVHINGVDMELNYYHRTAEVMQELGCRLFNCDHEAGCPSETMLMDALQEVGQVAAF